MYTNHDLSFFPMISLDFIINVYIYIYINISQFNLAPSLDRPALMDIFVNLH